MTDLRNVASLILAVALFQVGSGLLGVVTPLDLEAMGASDLVIGGVAAVFSAGFMMGAAYSPALLGQIGNIRAFAAAAGLNAASALLLALTQDTVLWVPLRLVQGMCFAVMFASAESWMTDATPSNRRGSVLGVYHVMAKVALVCGPFLAVGTVALDIQPYLWVAVFLCFALLPVCMTRRNQPPPPDTDPFPLSQLTKVAPAAVAGCFIAGVSNTGVLALLPIYAADLRPEDATAAAAVLIAAVWAGGLLSQWPAGWISDRVDRRYVVAGLGAMAGVASVILALLSSLIGWTAICVLLGLWGAGALSFYGICVAHAADRAEPTKIARMMSGLLFVWAVGSVIGPVLFGFVMDSPLGVRGLFWLEAVFAFGLVFAMLWRRTARGGTSDEQQVPFTLTQPTSVSTVEGDPRTDATNPPATPAG